MGDKLFTISFLVFIFFLSAITCSANVRVNKDSKSDYLTAKECIAAADYLCANDILEKLLKEAIDQKDSLSIATYNLDLANTAYQTGKFKEARTYLNSAATIAMLNKYTDIMARARQQQAHIEWRYGDNLSAIRNISESIQLYEDIKDTSSLLLAKAILAGIYVSIKKYKESEAIYTELLQTATRTKDTTAIITCYQHLGVVSYYKGDYEQALKLYKAAVLHSEKQKNELLTALNQGNIGEAYMAMDKLTLANEYLQKSLVTLEKLDFNSGIIFVLYTLGSVHHALEQYELANEYYYESISLMNSTGEIRERNYVYRLISENMVAQGKFIEALNYFKKHSLEKDSLFGIEKTRQLEELRAKYLLQESESENVKLSQQNIKVQHEISVKQRLINYQYIITGIIFFSLLIFVFQFYILRKRKAKLEASNRTKNRLFNLIAHDIKNPVGNIVSLVSLYDQTEEESEKSKLISMLKQSSQSVSILVNSILSWSISNKEGFNFNYQKLNLYDLTERVVGLFIFNISQKNIQLNNRVDPSFEAVCDEDIISTIIRNLLSNAIKFTPSNGEVSIWIEVTNKFKEIHVKDNGVGMDLATKDNILNGNKVGSKKGTHNEKGTGVGFTLINDFIEKFNGSLEIISEPNKGSEVIVYIPTDHG